MSKRLAGYFIINFIFLNVLQHHWCDIKEHRMLKQQPPCLPASTWPHNACGLSKTFLAGVQASPPLHFAGWTWHDIVAMWPAGGCI